MGICDLNVWYKVENICIWQHDNKNSWIENGYHFMCVLHSVLSL